MPRRIIVLGLLAVLSALSTGCCGRIRQCIANRWNYFHGGGGVCCTPAFKVPSTAPVFHGAAAPGCASCATSVPGPVTYAVPPAVFVGAPAGVPVLTPPRPILTNPTVEPVPSPMPGTPRTGQ